MQAFQTVNVLQFLPVFAVPMLAVKPRKKLRAVVLIAFVKMLSIYAQCFKQTYNNLKRQPVFCNIYALMTGF